MKMKHLLFGVFLVMGQWFSAQYQPIDTADYTQRKQFLLGLKSKNEALIKKYKTQYSGKTRSEIEKFYKEFYTNFEQNIKDKDYTFHQGFNGKLNKILEKIRKNNTQIPENLNILVAKDNNPNAACLADGTFIVNMGLFSWLKNEEQIAGVLSHEIAHYLLEHSIKSLVNSINEEKNTKNSPQGKRTYEKHKNAFEIIKNRAYKHQEENRKQEIQADSLGYVLFKNSGYEKGEFHHALNRLKEYDSISPRPLKIETYKKLYTLPNQPFNEKWLKKEDFEQYNYDLYKTKLDKDSLSSHPEIEQRLATLEKNFPELKTLKKTAEADKKIQDLKKIARMEILPNLYHSEDYGAGIYVAMQFLQDREEEQYHRQWLGKLFEKIYEARKNYQLNRYLDRIEPKEQSESYQQFLNFMWNLSLAEIKNIADFYHQKQEKS